MFENWKAKDSNGINLVYIDFNEAMNKIIKEIKNANLGSKN